MKTPDAVTTVHAERLALTVTGKAVDACPCGTTTVAGTVAALGTLLANVTDTPAGALPVSEMVPIGMLPGATRLGEMVRLDNDGGRIEKLRDTMAVGDPLLIVTPTVVATGTVLKRNEPCV